MKIATISPFFVNSQIGLGIISAMKLCSRLGFALMCILTSVPCLWFMRICYKMIHTIKLSRICLNVHLFKKLHLSLVQKCAKPAIYLRTCKAICQICIISGCHTR